MKSKTFGHYPLIRFSDGQKWLFNPILKKRFANRPEERVRLQYVEYLLRETAVTKNRIGFEALVKAYSRDNSLRADLVIFDEEISPMALIECKSGRIKLDGKTAEQAARYNLTLQADYLMITNGLQDFWYKRHGQSVASINSHPFDHNAAPPRSSVYWKDRGFIDDSLSSNVKEVSSGFLDAVFSGHHDVTVTYLNLPSDITPIPINHYYRIEQVEKNQIAFSLVAAPGQTLFAAMLNRDGQNQGVIWIPLENIIENDNSTLHRLKPEGESDIEFPPEIRELFRAPSETHLKKLAKQLINLFD